MNYINRFFEVCTMISQIVCNFSSFEYESTNLTDASENKGEPCLVITMHKGM